MLSPGVLPESASIRCSSPRRDEKAASRKLAALLEGVAAERGNTLLLEFLKLMDGRGVVFPPTCFPGCSNPKTRELRQRLTPFSASAAHGSAGRIPTGLHFVKARGRSPRCRSDRAQTHLGRRDDRGTLSNNRDTTWARPAAAREWVEEALPKEKHGNRMKLLKSSPIGLTQPTSRSSSAVWTIAARPSDKPLRVSCAICPIRARPAHAQPCRRDVHDSRRFGPVLEESKLVCTPPSELEPDWERDGFKKKAAEGEGLRALRGPSIWSPLCPPSFWAKQFGLEPAELYARRGRRPFAESVISGWRIATFRFDQPSPAWLGALWQYYSESLAQVENRTTLGVTVGTATTAVVLMERFLTRDAAEASPKQHWPKHSSQRRRGETVKRSRCWRDGRGPGASASARGFSRNAIPPGTSQRRGGPPLGRYSLRMRL